MPIRTSFASVCRSTRLARGISQRQLAGTVGVSRGYLSKLEHAQANPSVELMERVAAALGIDIELVARTPVVIGGGRQRDIVHARCSGHVDRRLRVAGWLTAREVEVVHGRSHGWIDLLAFDRTSGTLLIIEIKTRLDDLGAIERQLSWYGRAAFDVARRSGWRPRRVGSWLLVLASDEVEASIRVNRELLAVSFPNRTRQMSALLRGGGDHVVSGRGLALIDPANKRRVWILSSRLDGRRSPTPYVDYADAARRLGS